MRKVHYQTDQEELVSLADGPLWTLYDDRFVKAAASDTFTRDMLREHAPDDDHFMVHLVAMGSMEKYGFNKNGDSFPAEMLKETHPTFVSHGHLFREHRNRDAAKEGIGHIKASAYNEAMDRVELVVHANREKAAKEYERAKNGEPLSFSMSIRVPWDKCSCCGNKASSPKAYCDHLKNSMTQYVPGVNKYAHAINEKGTFFDISVVEKPADRIAHYIDYAFADKPAEKAAAMAHVPVITGTQWADYEGVTIPDEKIKWAPDDQVALEKLAQAETYLMELEKSASYNKDHKSAFAKEVVPIAFDGELSDEQLTAFRQIQPGTLFRGLAKRATLLPFYSFAAYATDQTIESAKNDPIVKQACCMMPGMFNKMMSGAVIPDIMGLFDAGSESASGCDSANTDAVQALMDKASHKFSVKTEPVRRRVVQVITIKGASVYDEKPEKNVEISLSDEDKMKSRALAESYGIYKISAMRDIISLSDYKIDESHYLLAVGQNL